MFYSFIDLNQAGLLVFISNQLVRPVSF